MIVLLQRVRRARVKVSGDTAASIKTGLVVFVAAERDDDEKICDRTSRKIAGYRIFEDEKQKMNLSVADVRGEILLVPQFTLAANTRHGMRPGFSTAAPAQTANRLFDKLAENLRLRHPAVKVGRFGTYMDVELVNTGPATFLLVNRNPSSISEPV